MPPLQPQPDATRCPLCGSGNECAMTAAGGPVEAPRSCWCQHASFDAALLARVPPAARGRACICAQCAAAAAASPERSPTEVTR